MLSGRWTRAAGRERRTIEYVVDAKTFAPIAARSTTRSDVATATVDATFANYERIALTRENADLLKIHPPRPPKTVELTIEEIKNPG